MRLDLFLSLTHVMAGTETESVAFLLVTPVLLVVVLLAAYIPARRASLVDPTRALRYD